MSISASKSADLVYYFDTTNGCNQGHIRLSPGQKATIKETGLTGVSNTGEEQEECSITIQSETGFDIFFPKGKIYDCDVKLTIHGGSSKHSSAIVSQF